MSQTPVGSQSCSGRDQLHKCCSQRLGTDLGIMCLLLKGEIDPTTLHLLFCLSFPFPPLSPDAFASPSPGPGLQTYANMPSLQLSNPSILLFSFQTKPFIRLLIPHCFLSLLCSKFKHGNYRNERKTTAFTFLVLFYLPMWPFATVGVCTWKSPVHVLHTYCRHAS